MAIKIKASDFVSKAKSVVALPTYYVQGCYGVPMTPAAPNEAKLNQTEYNKKHKTAIKAAMAQSKYFGFDCVCFIKGILWGFNGDRSKSGGGAVYGSNGVPDINADAMAKVTEQSKIWDIAKMDAGETLHMAGHIGIYVGEGLCVESTPAWDSKGVKFSVVGNLPGADALVKKTGYPKRSWVSHGHLQYVDYGDKVVSAVVSPPTATHPTLRKGSKGNDVKTLQTALNKHGYKLDVDGSFGPLTDAAVRAFQKSKGLAVDGSVGPLTWGALG
ncbi:hypothetical protein FACS1894217_12230 [Clostridia bacterium]|nr:hypothetical protein FACS1894202_07810 [Clostridia bacterium]GHV08944.1 hypothetical protein FACS1894217_12230 [Clostridia bacterium]